MYYLLNKEYVINLYVKLQNKKKGRRNCETSETGNINIIYAQ
jgi:hypothetical protein